MPSSIRNNGISAFNPSTNLQRASGAGDGLTAAQPNAYTRAQALQQVFRDGFDGAPRSFTPILGIPFATPTSPASQMAAAAARASAIAQAQAQAQGLNGVPMGSVSE